MTRILAILLVLLLPLPAADLPLSDGQRIIYSGDSYTAAPTGTWGGYLTSYLILRNPTLTLHCQEFGFSGANIAAWVDDFGTTYSYHRKYFAPLAPNYIFNFSISNGGYNKATYKAYQQDWVDNYIVGISAAEPILIGMSPDPALYAGNNGSFFEQYADADGEIAVAASPDWKYVDLFSTLQSVYTHSVVFTAATDDILTSTTHGLSDGERVVLIPGITPPGGLPGGSYYYVRDATPNTFKLSATQGGAAIDVTSTGSGTHYASSEWAKLRYLPDVGNFHRSRASGIVDAYHIITGLGWGTDVCAATINGSAATLTSQTDCTVTSIVTNAFGGIDFSMLPERLEWAIDEAARADAEILYPAMIGWQARTLTVTGLAAGSYDIYEGGVILGTKTHTEFAAGVNMTLFRSGPTFDQIQEVLGRIRDMQGIDRTTLLEITSPGRQGVMLYRSAATGSYPSHSGSGGAAAHAAALASQITEIGSYDALIHTQAQPVNRAYQLRMLNFAPTGPKINRGRTARRLR